MKLPPLRSTPPLPTGRHALFLGFDGTLFEHIDHPGKAVLPETVPVLLAGLERRLEGALAIVSGRRLESIDRLLAPLRLRAAGVHGAQMRLDPAEAMIEARAMTGVVERLRARFADDEAVSIEDKGAAVAVHYPETTRSPVAIHDSVMAAIADPRLDVLAGRGRFEVRSQSHRQDVAVRDFMSRSPFRNRIPVFVGDDGGDEDAIREAQNWGGIGIKVGTGRSAAHWRLTDPAAVIDWLRETLWSLPDP